MQLSTRYRRLYLILLAIAGISCNKSTLRPDRLAQLTGKDWKLTAWNSSPGYPLYYTNGTLENNYENVFDLYKRANATCNLLRNFSFDRSGEKNGTYNEKVGNGECTDVNFTENGTWEVLDNGSNFALTLVVNPGQKDEDVLNTLTVETLTEKMLVVSYPVLNQGKEYQLKMTFSAP